MMYCCKDCTGVVLVDAVVLCVLRAVVFDV